MCAVAVCSELRQDERQWCQRGGSKFGGLDERQRMRVACAEIEVRVDHSLIDVFAVWRVGPDSCFSCVESSQHVK